MSNPYIPSTSNGNGTHGTEGVANRRRKGTARLSCAECRRLKLRCDRRIPCSSCVKRGCGAICPDGSLTTGQGNRFVLASTQELHEKISELSNRIRQLEDALRDTHGRLSPQPHPLLTEDLLRVKAPLEREPTHVRNASEIGFNEEENSSDIVDAFGSLSISMSGRAKYFGQFAGSYYFFQNESPEDEDTDDRMITLQTILPPEVLERSHTFPISPNTSTNPELENDRISALSGYLPPVEKADELRSVYYQFAAWMYNPVSADTFQSQVFAQFYDPNATPVDNDPLVSHRLSLMFMVLAIGSLMNIQQPAYNIEAEEYHQLARAALFQNSLFDEPTISAVQALYLMSFYLFLADRHGTGSGTRWAIMGLAVKVAQSIGLHRDSGRWKVGTVETQLRRELFWELFTYDSWQCLTFGRPPSFSLAHVDCKMPYLGDPADDQAFHAWKHRFCGECMSVIHDQAFSARTPTYGTVLQLDRKMRSFPVPPILQVAGFGSSEPRSGGFPNTITLILQRHIVLAIREMSLLYLHRSFFARAVSDHPKDPLASPYGTSVIAAYRSAGSLVALMRNLHSQLKEPSERMWFLWTHMFSCAIVLGSIVTRCPSMSLAPSALVQLDSACELFSKAAPGFRAQKVLLIMLRLQEKAHTCLEEYRKSGNQPRRRNPVGNASSSDDPNDELSILGGKTRLVAKGGSPASPSSPSEERSPMMDSVVPLPLMRDSGLAIHPNVMEYLQMFTAPQAPVQVHSGTDGPSVPSSTFSAAPMFTMSEYDVYDDDLTTPTYDTVSTSQVSAPSTHPAHSPHDPHPMMSSTNFPQYFPVYDYSTGMNGSSAGYGNAVDLQGRQPVVHRRESKSPESNMETTWQDFVAGLGM